MGHLGGKRAALRATLLLGPLLALLGCGPGEEGPRVAEPAAEVLVKLAPAEWPQALDDLDPESLRQAIDATLPYYARVPAERVYEFGPRTCSAAELEAGLRRLREIVVRENPERWWQELMRDFELYRSLGRDGRGEVLFTGYFEPLLKGSRTPRGAYRYPLYEVPEDLIQLDLEAFGIRSERRRLAGRLEGRELVPYPEREAIDWQGALNDGRAQVLAYVDDPVKAFFLHVQGSGTILFPDGSRLRAGYAATNGHPYRSIGRLLLDEGLMSVDEMSMAAIERYLAAHPGERRRVLGANPSYVFFRALDPTGGPLGCYEIPLVAGRSIATDRRLFPAPVPAWVSAPIPDGQSGTRPMERLVVNLDTGGAITGPGRVDLFFGAGDEAGQLAGRTKHLGRLMFLLPKSADESEPTGLSGPA